jgi:hypothetical protein
VFPAAQIYHMQVQITGLLKPGQTPDLTRNGVATGYVVVPEFPTTASTILMIGALLGTLMILQRRNSKKVTEV